MCKQSQGVKTGVGGQRMLSFLQKQHPDQTVDPTVAKVTAAPELKSGHETTRSVTWGTEFN